MSEFKVLLSVMLELFAFIILGYILVKMKQIDKHSNQILSSLVANVFSPALIIGSVFSKSSINNNEIVIEAIFYGIILYIFYLIFNSILFKFIKFNQNESNIFKLSLIFANTAFIGYPILKSIFGELSIFIFSLVHLSFNILLFSYGANLLSKSKQKELFSIKQLLSPGFLCSIVAIILYFSKVSCPEPVYEFLNTLGNVSIPLSMIVIGATLGFVDIKEVLKNKNVYFITFIKLIILPIITSLFVKILPCQEFIKQLLVFSTILPSGSMVVILSNKYNNNYSLATATVFLSTLLSIITIPVMLSILKIYG